MIVVMMKAEMVEEKGVEMVVIMVMLVVVISGCAVVNWEEEVVVLKLKVEVGEVMVKLRKVMMEWGWLMVE